MLFNLMAGAGISLHDRWSAVNVFLHLLPFRNSDNRFMAVFQHFPILTGNEVYCTGADTFLMRPADQMCAFVKRIAQNMADSGCTPRIVICIKLCIGFLPCNRTLSSISCLPIRIHPPAIQRKVIDFADNRRRFRVNNQMSLIFRVTR